MPGTGAVLVENSAWLFYNTNHQHLAVEVRPLDGIGEITKIAAEQDVEEGSLRNPSYLASTKYRGVPLVVGMNHGKTVGTTGAPRATGEDNMKFHIDILSPVPKRLLENAEEEYNKSVAVCASLHGKDAWAFAVHPVEDRKKNITPTLFMYPSPTFAERMLSGANPGEKSALASYVKNEKIFVIYSAVYDKYNSLYEYDVFSQKASRIAPVNDPTPGTPLAVVYVAETDNVYLYFCAYEPNRRALRRTVKSNTAEWSDPVNVTDANVSRRTSGSHTISEVRVHVDSQITVLNHGNKNHIFFTRGGEQELGSIEDNLL